jgi:DNA end-binding protein Ku
VGQAVWTGSIAFGLVNIPVKLYPATQPKDVRFHLYDRRTGKRVRYERVIRDEDLPTFEPEIAALPPSAASRPAEAAPPRGRADAPEETDERVWPSAAVERVLPEAPPYDRHVDTGDIVRGVELPTGDLVTVEEEELAALAPTRSRTIEIEEFVDLADIDPVFFEKSYHVAPVRASGAEKPYLLLLRAMSAAKMVGIGRFVLRTKPHLVAIRALNDVLVLETLFFADEVRDAGELARGLAGAAVSEREVKTAQQLIAALATKWIPEKHGDEYREELLNLLRSKTPAVQPELPEAVTPAGQVTDLMAILRASVEEAKKKTAEKPRAKTAKGSKRRAG